MQPPKASPQSRTYILAQALESTCMMLLPPASSQAPTCKLSSLSCIASRFICMGTQKGGAYIVTHVCTSTLASASSCLIALALRSMCILLQFTASELYLLILKNLDTGVIMHHFLYDTARCSCHRLPLSPCTHRFAICTYKNHNRVAVSYQATLLPDQADIA